VHKCAEEWEGSPNKNYGDKFCITWKLSSAKDNSSYQASNQFDEEMKEKHELLANAQGPLNQSLNEADASHAELFAQANKVRPEEDDAAKSSASLVELRKEQAERALMTAVKIIAELRRFKDLQAYSDHPKIAQAKFQNGYKTRMTFGLHAGQAVESAIGSEFKLDALYLSQDQMVSLRLESLCQIYSTSMLASEPFYELLSLTSQRRLR